MIFEFMANIFRENFITKITHIQFADKYYNRLKLRYMDNKESEINILNERLRFLEKKYALDLRQDLDKLVKDKVFSETESEEYHGIIEEIIE